MVNWIGIHALSLIGEMHDILNELKDDYKELDNDSRRAVGKILTEAIDEFCKDLAEIDNPKQQTFSVMNDGHIRIEVN